MTDVYTFGGAFFRVRDIIMVRYEYGTETELQRQRRDLHNRDRELSHCAVITLVNGKELVVAYPTVKACEAVLSDLKECMERLEPADHAFINSKLPGWAGPTD